MEFNNDMAFLLTMSATMMILIWPFATNLFGIIRDLKLIRDNEPAWSAANVSVKKIQDRVFYLIIVCMVFGICLASAIFTAVDMIQRLP